ncbi:MAG: HAMP domain-containing sensor histidine kinase [Thermoleophilaceae bacterium]
MFLSIAAIFTVAVLVLALSSASRSIETHELVVFAVGLAAIVLITRRALRPLMDLSEATRLMDSHVLGQRLPRCGNGPEVTNLTSAFNDLLARLEQERLTRARQHVRAQEEERRRIARELHDEVGQSLTAVLLYLDKAAQTSGQTEAIVDARETARASLEYVRLIARHLRPDALDELGLGSAIAALATRATGQPDLEVSHDIETDLPSLPADTELAIYRIAQEGLTNALRHAGASRIDVTLSYSDGEVQLGIRDDGIGLGIAERGSGLRGMNERATLVGGDLSVCDRVERGTEVRFAIAGPELAR